MRLVCVRPEQVQQAWSIVQPLIVQAMKRGGVGDPGPVYADVVAGRSLLWLACDGSEVVACAITELTEAMGRKLCTIVACGGHARGNWLHLIEGLEDYARQEGCASTRIIGREGWKRVLPDYWQRAVILEKGL
jgi:hypothetical protein